MNDRDLIQKMCWMYKKKDMSLRAIGEATNMSHEQVRKMLGENVKRRPRKEINKKEMYQFFKKTNSYQDAADKYNVTRQYVYNVVVAMEAK